MQRGTMTALVAAVAVVVVAAAVVVLSGDGGGGAGAGADAGSAGAGGPIRLEPVGGALPDPFLDANLDLAATLGEAVAVGYIELPDGATDDVTAGGAGRSVGGDAAGLYGGSLDTAVCDVDQLVAFLTDTANADKAAAWAEVQGIEAADIASYVGGLTPVRLRLDTRVTNHTFEGGDAVPFPSILQAGTAVLVDARGVPRVRCFCGNPLAEPAPVPSGVDRGSALDLESLVENLQEAWEGLDADKIVSVQPGEEQDAIVVADLQTGERFERPVGTEGDEDRPAPGPGSGGGGPTTSTTAPSPPGSSGRGGGGCTHRTEVRPDGAVVEYCD